MDPPGVKKSSLTDVLHGPESCYRDPRRGLSSIYLDNLTAEAEELLNAILSSHRKVVLLGRGTHAHVISILFWCWTHGLVVSCKNGLCCFAETYMEKKTPNGWPFHRWALCHQLYPVIQRKRNCPLPGGPDTGEQDHNLSKCWHSYPYGGKNRRP